MPRKKDQYSSPSQKVISLYCLLMFTGNSYSLTQLARELNCSKPTVGRMVDQIDRSMGGRVKSKTVGREKVYWMPRPKQRPNVSLSPKEIQQLELCRGMVMHLLPGTIQEQLRHTIAKTTALLEDKDTTAEAVAPIASATIKGQIDYSLHTEHISTLLQAIRDKQVCEILYQSPRKPKPRTYPFAPTKLISYREALYVTGWLVQDKGIPVPEKQIMFAIHRIKDVGTQERTFNAKTPPDPDERLFGFMELEQLRVKIKFDKEMATYIKERIWSDDQIIREYKNGNIDLEFTAQSMSEVLCWVLGFGMHAKVMEPVELKRRVQAEIHSMMERYTRKAS